MRGGRPPRGMLLAGTAITVPKPRCGRDEVQVIAAAECVIRPDLRTPPARSRSSLGFIRRNSAVIPLSRDSPLGHFFGSLSVGGPPSRRNCQSSTGRQKSGFSECNYEYSRRYLRPPDASSNSLPARQLPTIPSGPPTLRLYGSEEGGPIQWALPPPIREDNDREFRSAAVPSLSAAGQPKRHPWY
jgi:hypothetical protein